MTWLLPPCSDVGKKFKLYDVQFLDADGNEVAPNGTVSIRFPIAAGYDSANCGGIPLWRMASKVLVKGSGRERLLHRHTPKSAGIYALVEKGSAITDAENSGAQWTTNRSNQNRQSRRHPCRTGRPDFAQYPQTATVHALLARWLWPLRV